MRKGLVIYDANIAEVNTTPHLGWRSCFITFPFAELMKDYQNDIRWITRVTRNSGKAIIRYCMWMLSDAVRNGQLDEDYQWAVIHDMIVDEVDEEMYEQIAIPIASIMDYLLIEIRSYVPPHIQLLQVISQEVESDWPENIYFCAWYH